VRHVLGREAHRPPVAQALTRTPPAPLLLPSKLSPPLARSRLVGRPGLIEQLDAARSRAVVLLVAPAGYGKTTLLVAWQAHASRHHVPLAWVSLEAADNDPVRFWTVVVAALEVTHPGLGAKALPYLNDLRHETLPAEQFVTALAAELAARTSDVVLVLDDYHLIQTSSIHAGLRALLERRPPPLHLILSARADPPLPLARLRANDQLRELRAADLRFSADEAGVFLSSVMGLALSQEQVAALDARTEGWPAGLQLAALSLRERPDAECAIAGFTGSHRFVVDYLVEEVLTRLPEAERQFLERTSILGQLSPGLCDAVSGGEGSAAILEQLERAGLFVSAVDDQRRWYRYHHLFADALRHRLQRDQPALVRELHQRASHWYATMGLFEEAVEHALAGQEWDHAGQLLELVARSLLDRGQQATLRRWLSSLPITVRRTHPTLSGNYAVTLLITGELSALATFLRHAEPALETRGDERALGRLLAIHAQLAVTREDLDLAASCAERALARLPEQDVSYVAAALLAHGTVSLRRGELAMAAERLERVRALSRQVFVPMARLRLRTLLGELAAAAGQLGRAEAAFREVLDETGDKPLVMGEEALVSLAGLLREWNRLDEATACLDTALASRGRRGRAAAVSPALALERGRVLAAQGQTGPAGEALAAAIAAAQRVGNTRLERLAQAEQMRLLLRFGDLAAAVAWADAVAHHPEDELVRFEHLPAALTLIRVRLAQHQPTAVAGLLGRLIQAAESGGRQADLIELLLLRSLALAHSGDEAGSLAALERGLELAEPAGYVRRFLDEGEPLRARLRQALQRGLRPRYVGVLLGAFAGPAAAARPVEWLTPREREVLGLLALGRSNRDIAAELVLSDATVKTHVHNLIGKLGVSSRTQVLVRARQLGVLDAPAASPPSGRRSR